MTAFQRSSLFSMHSSSLLTLLLFLSLLPSFIESQFPNDPSNSNDGSNSNNNNDGGDGSSSAPTVIFYGFFFFLIFLLLFWLGLRRWVRWRRFSRRAATSSSSVAEPIEAVIVADEIPIGVPVQPAQWPPRAAAYEYGTTVYRLGDSLHSPQQDVELVSIEIVEPPANKPDDHSHHPIPSMPPPTYADIATKKSIVAGSNNRLSVMVPSRQQQQQHEPSYVRSPTRSPTRLHAHADDVMDPPSYKGAPRDLELVRDEPAS